jgi:hypothetical protein
MRRLQSICLVGALGIGPAALGGIIGGPEVEPNNSIESADYLGALGADDFTFVIGSLAPGDIDFFAIDLVPYSIVYATIGSIGFNNPNVLIAMFDSAGTLLETSLEYPVKFGPPVLVGDVPSAGRYYLTVTGITDLSFVGDHNFSFEYGLDIGTLSVPAPGSFAPIVAIAVSAGRRRRM